MIKTVSKQISSDSFQENIASKLSTCNSYNHPQTDLFRSSVAIQYFPVAGIETRLTQTSTQTSYYSATRRY